MDSEIVVSIEAIGVELSLEQEAASGMVPELRRLLIVWTRVMILYGPNFDHYTCERGIEKGERETKNALKFYG